MSKCIIDEAYSQCYACDFGEGILFRRVRRIGLRDGFTERLIIISKHFAHFVHIVFQLVHGFHQACRILVCRILVCLGLSGQHITHGQAFVFAFLGEMKYLVDGSMNLLECLQ